MFCYSHMTRHKSGVVFKSNVNDNMPSDQALMQLKRGNTRFVNGLSRHPHSDRARMTSLAHQQHPFAATLSCSDSRVPPDIIFDQGLGDLFQVRNAGNVLDKATIGSLEYAVSHLGVNLIVVMGHDDCGAVKAAMNPNKEKSIYLNEITHYIYPSVKQAKYEPYDTEHTAEVLNCKNTVKKLSKNSKIISNAINEGRLKVVPAMYDTETGYVDFLK